MNQTSFRKYRPLSIRLWHWLNAFAILGLLLTVLIRKTLLSWRTNSVVISNKLEETGVTISSEFAREIAVTIRNPLWDWHIYLGYLLGILIIWRIFYAFLKERKCVILTPIFKFQKNSWHKSLVELTYAIFYLSTLFMVISGVLLIFKTDLALSKELSGSIKDTHELMMWLFVVFTGLHLVGVIIAENRNDKGIVSEMISGGSKS